MSKPERLLTPDRSALDRFGYELRKWRKQRGLSQAEAGKLVHVSGALLHKIEIGERRPSRDLALRCDSALGADGELIRAWEDFDADDRSMPVGRGDADINTQLAMALPGSEIVIVPMMNLTGEYVPVAIDRRAFVASAASLPLVGWIGRAVPELPTMPEGDLSDVLREMVALRAVLVRQDNLIGSGAVVPTIIHQLSILETLSRSARGAARESVRLVQAAYAEFAGWLADELGERRAGQYWTDRALEWAHEIDDDLLIGYTLARKAQRALESGEVGAAVSLARAAQRRGGMTNRVRAAALQYEALGHASAREVSDFRASIERAHELVASSGAVADNEKAAWCTPGYVVMHEAAGWARLDEHARAVAEYERGLINWPIEFRRDEGVYLGRLAYAHARSGNPEQAADVGRKALDMAISTGSARILTELRPLESALTAWQAVPAAVKLAAAIQRALPGSGSESPHELEP